jgi:biopolymer transport protein ExbD
VNFSSERRRAPVLLDLTPLIDVVFLLLIFFMVSTTFVQDAAGLKIDLPRSDNRDAIDAKQDVSIRVAADGGVFVDDAGVTLESLREHLAAAAKKNPETMVVLEADQAVDHGRVVEVLDLARDLGLTRFAIATEAPQ